jgi:hypothetical protein
MTKKLFPVREFISIEKCTSTTYLFSVRRYTKRELNSPAARAGNTLKFSSFLWKRK